MRRFAGLGRTAAPEASVEAYSKPGLALQEDRLQERMATRVLEAVVSAFDDFEIYLMHVIQEILEGRDVDPLGLGPDEDERRDLELPKSLEGHLPLRLPDVAQADAALRAGALWNTLVFAAKVDLLWTLGWQCLPDMMPLFERLSQAIGGPEEGRALEAIYRDMPAKNFSSDLLQRVPEKLAVVELNDVLWSDWGKPERITETLRRIDRRPAFPLTCLDHPFVPLPTTAAEGGVPMSV